MRILFIWPNRDTFGVKPMGISLLTSILEKAGHEVDLFDTSFIDLGTKDYNQELTARGYFKPVDYGCDTSKQKVDVFNELQKAIDRFKPELYMVSVLDDEVLAGASIVEYINKTQFNVPVVIGNKGVSALRKKLPYCLSNSFVCGEAIDIITDIKAITSMTNVTHPKFFRDLNSLPYLDWSLFDPRHFLRAYDGKVYRSGDHMIGWGCVNSCTYCINESWREMHGGMKGCMRRYSVSRIIDELEFLATFWRLEFFKFHDEDFLLKPLPYLKELAKEYARRIGLPFTCMVNARSVTAERVKWLVSMGCVSVSMGVETGNLLLRSILNRKEKPADIISASQILQYFGIRVSSFNMIGLPWETEETIRKTIDLNRAADIKHPNVSFFIPLEGTRLHDISVAAGFYKPGSPVSTNKPSLRLPGISEERLVYYYDNFYRLVTE